MSIRSAAKAIIIKDEKILLNKCRDEKIGIYYTLPGGGQRQYETLHEAVVWECLEETGYTVVPVRFAALYEEIQMDAEVREKDPDYAHKIYHIFVCEMANKEAEEPTEKDTSQIASEWVEIAALENIRLFPRAIGENIVSIARRRCFCSRSILTFITADRHSAIRRACNGFEFPYRPGMAARRSAPAENAPGANAGYAQI